MGNERNRKPRELEITIRDPVYGQLNPLPDGMYEMNISITVLVNGRPGYGFFYQFVVDALPQGNRQLLTEGKASAKIKLSGKRPPIAVEIGNERGGYKRYPIKDFPIDEFLSKDKEGKKSPKISIISQMADSKSFSVVVALVDENGKCVSGNINYLDADPGEKDPEPRLYSNTIQDSKSLSLGFTRDKESREVIVFLQGNPAEKVEVEIPALVKEEKKTRHEEEIKKIREETELATAKKNLKNITEPADRKIPDHICVNFAGPRGEQKLIISVAAKDESLLIGFKGAITDGDDKKTFQTGPDGTAVYKSKFTEKSRAFEVRAGNIPELIWRGRLLGPKKNGGE